MLRGSHCFAGLHGCLCKIEDDLKRFRPDHAVDTARSKPELRGRAWRQRRTLLRRQSDAHPPELVRLPALLTLSEAAFCFSRSSPFPVWLACRFVAPANWNGMSICSTRTALPDP